MDSLKSSVGKALITRLDQLCIECRNDQMPGIGPIKDRDIDNINKASKSNSSSHDLIL